MDDEAFQEYLGDNLPEPFIVHFMEEVKDKASEPVGVCVRIPKMEDHGAEKMVLALKLDVSDIVHISTKDTNLQHQDSLQGIAKLQRQDHSRRKGRIRSLPSLAQRMKLQCT